MTTAFTPVVFGVTGIAPDESLPGYFVRVADRNQYETVSWLRELASRHAKERIPSMEALLSNTRGLAALGAGLYPGGALLSQRAWHPLETASSPYIRYRAVALPKDALRLRLAQVCPRCLAEEPYIRDDWDLSYVAICPRHGNWLIDSCAECDAPIKGLRARVCICPNCGADLRVAPVEPASDEEVAVTEDAASLAPVRLAFDAKRLVVQPGDLYILTLLLARPRHAFLANEPCGLALASAPIGVRKPAVQQLARCKDGPALDCRLLRQLLASHFEHIAGTFGERAARHRVLETLQTTDLLGPVTRFLVTGDDGPAPDMAQRYAGRPPQLQTPRDVALFLGCGEDEVEHLMKTGVVAQPSFGYAFDADEILSAQSLLETLIPQEQLDGLIGFSGASSALAAIELLEIWPAKARASPHFVASKVIQLWDNVRLAAASPRSTKESIRLQEALASYSADSYAFTRIVAQIVSLGLPPVRWEKPWRLTDLYFDRKQLEGLLKRISIAPLPRRTPTTTAAGRRA